MSVLLPTGEPFQVASNAATVRIEVNGHVVVENMPLRLILRFVGRAKGPNALQKGDTPGSYKLVLANANPVACSPATLTRIVRWMRAADVYPTNRQSQMPVIQPTGQPNHPQYLTELACLYAAAITLDIHPHKNEAFLRQRLMNLVTETVLSAKDMQIIWTRIGMQDGGKVAQRMVTAYHERASGKRTPFVGEDDAIIEYCSSQPGLDELFYEIGALKAEWALMMAQVAYWHRESVHRGG